MTLIRPSREEEHATLLAIVNSAAEAYRGVIPPDRWHEPYMALEELRCDIADGVAFWVFDTDGGVVGLMGIQPRHDVDLIRHAYVLPQHQGRGVGAALIRHLRQQSARRMLVGTWSAATWAINFYRRHGFEMVAEEQKPQLLRTYWKVPERQIETSVVLANPAIAP
jgi:GNAT superfamily N-acetyltransferase